MKVLILLFIITVLFFISSITLLVLWKVRKNNNFKIIGLISGAISIVFGLIFVLVLISKSYDKVSEIFGPRTGIEVYSALLGEPKSDCINVLNHKDQTVPKLDVAIILYCNTCKIEVDRLIQRHDFEIDTLIDFNTGILSEQLSWFNEIKLGDTVIVYHAEIKPGKQWQNLYVSVDNTKVLIEDILD